MLANQEVLVFDAANVGDLQGQIIKKGQWVVQIFNCVVFLANEQFFGDVMVEIKVTFGLKIVKIPSHTNLKAKKYLKTYKYS